MTITRDSINPDKALTQLYDMQNHLLKLNNFSSLIRSLQDGLQKEWYETGELKSEQEMKDGKRNGASRGWFRNGQMKYDIYYKNHLQQGSDKEWYETGKPLRSAEYINNEINGRLVTYWPNGQLRRIDIYDMGTLKEGLCFDSLGNKVSYIKYLQMPQFPNGDVDSYLAHEIRYPIIAQKNGIQGTVIVQFLVDRQGAISNIKIVKSVDSSLDMEAVRAVNLMPKWIPGKRDGEPIKVNYTLPINFRLQ